MEVAKINTSFLTLFWVLRTLVGIIPLFFVVKTLDLEDVLIFLFDDNGISICCKELMAMTLFLSLTVLKTIFLAVLVFFVSLVLVDRRLLGVFITKYVYGRGVSKLIPSKSFFADLYSWRLLASVLQISESTCSNAFAFSLMVFLTASFQKSNSRSQASK